MVEISVIVPLYNGEKYIKRCYESIKNQDFNKEIEIIFVNDGSSDNSINILNELKQKDVRIKIISQENKKQGGARNTGIKDAAGKYISFIDVDDFISGDFLSSLYEAIEKYNADIAFSSVKRVKENGVESVLLKYDKIQVEEEINKKVFLAYSNGTGCGVWNKLYKREFLLKNNLFFRENVFYEDADYTAKAIYYAKRIVSVDRGFYYYYVNKKSTMRHNLNKKKQYDKYTGKKLMILFELTHGIKRKNCVAERYDFKLFGLNLLRIKENVGIENSIEKYYLFDLIKIFQRKIKTEV